MSGLRIANEAKRIAVAIGEDEDEFRVSAWRGRGSVYGLVALLLHATGSEPGRRAAKILIETPGEQFDDLSVHADQLQAQGATAFGYPVGELLALLVSDAPCANTLGHDGDVGCRRCDGVGTACAERIVGLLGSADLRCGRWQDVLADVECDALIFDAPYGARTHEGHDAGATDAGGRRTLDYDAMGEVAIAEVVDHWHPRTRGWFVTITSHDLIPTWERALERVGRYVFAPLPLVDVGMSVRLQGDGHSSWTCWVVIAARPKTAAMAKWGTLAGAYIRERNDPIPGYPYPGSYVRTQGDQRSERMGGKPLGVMRAIVRDHSRPGDLVCDPFAGGGTTLLAAMMEGREAVGAEMDPVEHAKAIERLGRGFTRDLFADSAPAVAAVNLDLFGGE